MKRLTIAPDLFEIAIAWGQANPSQAFTVATLALLAVVTFGPALFNRLF